MYRAYQAFDCALCPGWGNLKLPLKGGEFEPDLSLVLALYSCEFFRFLQGLTDLQDRILPLLVNNSFKRVLKRSLKVSSWHISLLKV